MKIQLSQSRDIDEDAVIELYTINNWSAAEKPVQLLKALKNSHSLVTAWDEDRLVGLGNSISDGHLVVYYPHLLVHPHYQGQGIGKMIMDKMKQTYSSFHMQMLAADDDAIDFYQKQGFERAGETEPMWICKT